MTTHKTGTRDEWLAARLELLDAEKELTRRSDELARRRQQLPGSRSTSSTGSTSTKARIPGRPVPGTLAADRPSLHVRARRHRRVPVLLVDRRRLRRLGRSPRPSRRHAVCGVTGSAGKTAGLQAADGLELPVRAT